MMVRTVPVYPGDGYHYTSSLSQTDESDQFSLSPLRMILSKETINLGAPYCRYILICCSLHSPEQRNLLVINLNVIPLLLLNWQDQSFSSQLWRLDLSLKTVTGLADWQFQSGVSSRVSALSELWSAFCFY